MRQESNLESAVCQDRDAYQRIGGFLDDTYLSQYRAEVGVVGAQVLGSVTKCDVERLLPSLSCEIEFLDDGWVRDTDIGSAVDQPRFVD